MDDDIITPIPKTPATPPDPDNAADSGEDRVFEITDDLNISPVKPASSEEPTLADRQEAMRKSAAALLEKELSGKPDSAPVLPKPANPSEPGINQLQQPAREIPMQDFSESLKKARNTPANPPAKTLGNGKIFEKPPVVQGPLNLQSAISSILPQNLGKKQQEKTPTPQNPGGPQDQILKPLRTYESDVAEVLSHKRASTASIVIAEAKKKEGEEKISSVPEVRPHTSAKLLLTILSLILIGAGVTGAYYLYSLSPLAGKTPVVSTPQVASSLIPSDENVTLKIDGLPVVGIISRIQAEVEKPQKAGTIKEIVLTRMSEGKTVRISAADMMGIMDIPAPDMLVRSLSPAWMLGVYADEAGHPSIFVVATNNFFQNAFAGMLQWERVMGDDLKRFIYPNSQIGIANTAADIEQSIRNANPLGNLDSILPATSTSTPAPTATSSKKAQGRSSMSELGAPTGSSASSTPTRSTVPTASVALTGSSTATTSSAMSYVVIRGHFEDRIVRNKDVRVFKTPDGQALFMYSFLDNSKLAVTGSESALAEILSRLENQTFVR